MVTAPHLWLRAEHRASEQRSPLTPEHAAKLVAAGMHVTVEQSGQRCFRDIDYQAAGCRLTAPGSWPVAPTDACILGLKELPDDHSPLRHRHIYFAHAYKRQPGATALLQRFLRGGGQLLDLETLCDDSGRRLAAFGYWAGYLGAALAVMNWLAQQVPDNCGMRAVAPWHSSRDLLEELLAMLQPLRGRALPHSLVIGAAGRCGSGARALLEALALPFDGWDIPETRDGGPFSAILDYDLLINCVLVQEALPPFLTADLLAQPARRLSVISDVSCDPGSPYNPLPVYTACTDFSQPSQRLRPGTPVLDLIAIDNLPSLLPMESSADFSNQLLPALLQLAEFPASPWQANLERFHHHTRDLKDA
ncbi:saccharopine dehydrogenase [Parahaliea aestuarii]|uniref:Saccharopine dehydrogenase [NAD(+), L-lysine-forming] n=1 Tax=Parahaliea aestuarii TaxID=1852021 RepID=A0A5C8ZT09_9GAMM|nr:saccharopine dehydrogenase [Parahaliea aestuarii]TXS90899.1 saccharopine dehydrogenase [Parahaliea aestuarii]